jgi:nucleoid-associated protein YgaU
MAASDRGTLEKLVIIAYGKEDYSGAEVARFTSYVNPNEITLAYEHEFDEAQGSGTTGSRMNFKKMKPGELSLVFFIDGTGANGELIDVQARIAEFQTATGYNGDIHRPNYLIVSWGTLTVRRCVLKGASIAYKMFKPNGVPLRAAITATFVDNADDKSRVAMAQDQSPDLTHVRIIRAGDVLPQLCTEIYGNPLLYLKVAAANGIDDFRALTPGMRVFFPPLEK